ncbi:MAG TPA: CvpA family protein [Alphaproteobacteria bacterium]|nr:CvpA family protein [Alphaproteobacteria bacterium]HNS44270.1 CvpA family protein [Alphaproteobacteria bacterium]
MAIATLIDIGVILVLLVSAGVSFFRGLVREVLTIVGVVGGALAALTFGGTLKPIVYGWYGIEDGKDAGKLFDMIPMELAADISAYALIFVGVFMVLQLASHFLASMLHAIGLGPVDRTLGVFFGVARGVLLLGVLYLPFHLVLSDENKKDWLSGSKTMFYVEPVSEWLASFMPSDEKAKETVTDEARDKLRDIDILGDKKISNEEKQAADKDSAPSQNGYDSKERGSMDTLIDQIKPAQENGPKKGGYNE